MRAQEFKVNIIGLSQKTHRFDYEFGDEFFDHYGKTILESGHFKAVVALNKQETMIEGNFAVEGHANFICDRSLEPFQYPMHIERTILFKYGQEEKELTDEIVLISRDRASLDVGQYLYELIGVSVPIKKLHPRFKNSELEESDIQLVYSSPIDESEKEEDAIDPRWEKLKKLK